jgi:predicted RNA methylase
MFVVANNIGKYIKLNDEAEYSVSRPFQSRQIMDFIAMTSNKEQCIVDANACVGGDTIYFAEYFRKVVAIEKNVDNYDLMVHNLDLFGFKNVVTLNQDCTVFDFDNADVIYFDPPWGGVDYKTKLDMKLSGIPISTIIKNLKKKYPYKYIFLKAPCGFRTKFDDNLSPASKNIYNRKGGVSFNIIRY